MFRECFAIDLEWWGICLVLVCCMCCCCSALCLHFICIVATSQVLSSFRSFSIHACSSVLWFCALSCAPACVAFMLVVLVLRSSPLLVLFICHLWLCLAMFLALVYAPVCCVLMFLCLCFELYCRWCWVLCVISDAHISLAFPCYILACVANGSLRSVCIAQFLQVGVVRSSGGVQEGILFLL